RAALAEARERRPRVPGDPRDRSPARSPGGPARRPPGGARPRGPPAPTGGGARQRVLAPEAVSAGPETEQWLAKRIADLRETVPPGTVGDRMPDEIRSPLRDAVGRGLLSARAL